MKFDSLISAYNRIRSNLEDKPAAEQLRLGIYWGVMTLSVLIFGFSIYHVQTIPAEIRAEISDALAKRPWTNDLVVVDGRNIYLRGTIEPDSGIENEISIISDVSGVQNVINVLEEEPKLSAHIAIQISQGQLLVEGQLNGEILEQIVQSLERSFPDLIIRDRIRIDDRLGRPLWVEGFDSSLESLWDLDEFQINGWRDRLVLTGLVDSDIQRRKLGYSVPASLIHQVRVTNQFRLPVRNDQSNIRIISNWDDTSITGMVASTEIRDKIVSATKQAFGDDHLNEAVILNENIAHSDQLAKIIQILPTLGEVHDLRLESSGDGYVVWGRVDSPEILGVFLEARNQAGLEKIVHNKISVSRGDKEATLALFSDGSQAVVSGILPSAASREKLFSSIRRTLEVREITNLTSIEPNVAIGTWMSNWDKLLGSLPGKVMGITIDEKSVLVTGNVMDIEQIKKLDTSLVNLVPELEHLNWVSTINQEKL